MLREDARTGTPDVARAGRGGLVIAQVALAFVLVGAGLLLASPSSCSGEPRPSEHVLTAACRFRPRAATTLRAFATRAAAIRASGCPGGATNNLPLSGGATAA